MLANKLKVYDKKAIVIHANKYSNTRVITRKFEYSKEGQKSRVPKYSVLGDGITNTSIIMFDKFEVSLLLDNASRDYHTTMPLWLSASNKLSQISLH